MKKKVKICGGTVSFIYKLNGLQHTYMVIKCNKKQIKHQQQTLKQTGTVNKKKTKTKYNKTLQH